VKAAVNSVILFLLVMTALTALDIIRQQTDD
jgi:hypothetical protein